MDRIQGNLNRRSDKISQLVEKLSLYDVAFESFKPKAEELLLSLTDKDFKKVILLLSDLFETSPFATAFFIEKIPTLLYYGLLDEFIVLISSIRHYGAREVAYLLGGNALKNDDLERVLRKTNLDYYKMLLSEVLSSVEKLESLSTQILRNSPILQFVVPNRNVKKFLLFKAENPFP